MKASRKYHLDWLRVAAFGLLIPFHVGMLYASWGYPLKSPRLAPDVEWVLMLSTPWRLALVFLIAGVASHHLIVKLGPGAFARERLLRLLPVLLLGMFVLNAPQNWAVARAHGYAGGFLAFWPHYLTRPRWDHLWFLLYLLPYSLVFAALWKGTRRLPGLPLALLLSLPALWLVVSGWLMDTLWPITDSLYNDWAAHLRWTGMFGFGIALAMREDVWGWIEARRMWSLVLTGVLALAFLTDHALWLKGMVTPPFDWLTYDTLGELFGWGLILSLLGFAAHYLNRPSPQLSYLNTAILPIYVLHQPILFLAATALFPLKLPLALEGALLVVITMGGALALYHVAIRPFAPIRFLFGVKVGAGPARLSPAHPACLPQSPASGGSL